jgi:Reverse transcriptase (RNA-dependent DNA polymerase)
MFCSVRLVQQARWNGILSNFFPVTCGARQGGILSPIFFNIYVDDLILNLGKCDHGCCVGRTFMGCIMYADDLILLSPTRSGMQLMLDICTVFSNENSIISNTK